MLHSIVITKNQTIENILGMDQVKIEPEDVQLESAPLYVVDLYMDIVKEDTELSQVEDNKEDVANEIKPELPVEDDEVDEDISYKVMGPPKVCSKCNQAWQPEVAPHKCHFSDGLLYKCPICPLKFNTKHNLKKHEKTHLAALNFKICNECGKVCKNVYFLMKHMREHNKLDKAQQSLKYKCNTRDHEPDQAQSLKYKCKYCEDKRFKRKSQWDAHMRLDHQCRICLAEFDSKDKVKLHTKCHLRRNVPPMYKNGSDPSIFRTLNEIPKKRRLKAIKDRPRKSYTKRPAKTSVESNASRINRELKDSKPTAATAKTMISCSPCCVKLKKVKFEPKKSAMDINGLISAVKEILIHQKGVRSVGRDYNIDKSTLSRYISKLNDANVDPSIASDDELAEFLSEISGKTGGKTILSAEQEKVLMTYLLKASEIYYGLSINELRTMSYEFVKKLGVSYPAAWDVNQKASYDWYYGFINRHPNLSLRTPEQISANRAKAFSAASASAFFANLSAVLDQQLFEPHRIWNVDETGCPTVISENSTRHHKRQRTSDKEGTNVSLAFAVSATGQSIPPFYIFPHKTMEKNFMDDTTPGSVGVTNESGWMTAIEFKKFMSHFIKYANATISSPILLLLDNHTSHLSVEAMDMAMAHGITMVSFPPHCSHRMQPLDVSVFGPFKAMFHHQCQVWVKNHMGRPLEVQHVPPIADKCLDVAATPKNIKFGFRATGIVPFDPNVFTAEDFLAASLSGENQCTENEDDDHPEDRRIIMVNSDVIEANAHEQEAAMTSVSLEPGTSSASTHNSLDPSRKPVNQMQAEEKIEHPKKRRRRVQIILTSSDSEEEDDCIICKDALPVKLNENNSIHCNVCDRAVHSKCVNLQAAHYTCVHCESD